MGARVCSLLASVAVNLLNPLAEASASVYPPALVFYATQVELAVGLRLILGRANVAAWAMAILIFGNFALLNVRAIWNGQSDCGCFGAVQVNPWWTLGASVPRHLGDRRMNRFTEYASRTLAIAGIALMVWAGMGLQTRTAKAAGNPVLNVSSSQLQSKVSLVGLRVMVQSAQGVGGFTCCTYLGF